MNPFDPKHHDANANYGGNDLPNPFEQRLESRSNEVAQGRGASQEHNGSDSSGGSEGGTRPKGQVLLAIVLVVVLIIALAFFII